MKHALPLLLAILALSSTTTFAAGYIRAGGMYMSESAGTTEMNESTRTLIDIGGGWVSGKGWTIGALYGTDKRKTSAGSTDRTSMGPTVGWITRKESGLYILGTYFLTSTLSPNYKGTGYEADLGYKFQIQRLALALQMSYKHFDYTRNGSASLDPSYKNNYIDPYIVLLFEF